MPDIKEVVELIQITGNYINSHGWTLKEVKKFGQTMVDTADDFLKMGQTDFPPHSKGEK